MAVGSRLKICEKRWVGFDRGISLGAVKQFISDASLDSARDLGRDGELRFYRCTGFMFFFSIGISKFGNYWLDWTYWLLDG